MLFVAFNFVPGPGLGKFFALRWSSSLGFLGLGIPDSTAWLRSFRCFLLALCGGLWQRRQKGRFFLIHCFLFWSWFTVYKNRWASARRQKRVLLLDLQWYEDDSAQHPVVARAWDLLGGSAVWKRLSSVNLHSSAFIEISTVM